MKDLLAEADAAYREERLDEAEAMLRRVLVKEPENANGNHLLGLIALRHGRHGEALAMIGRALAAHPRFARAHLSLALAQSAVGDKAAAEQSYRRALALNPELPAAAINLTGMLMQDGRLQAAVAMLRAAIKRMPTRFELHNNLGIALMRQGKMAQAVKAMEQALAVAPKSAMAHGNLARALRASGKSDEAAERYRRALEIEPKNAEMLTRLADVERERGNLGEAVFLAEQACKLDPQLAAAPVALALCRLEQGDLDEAEAEARRAIALAPGSNHAGLALAHIHELRGRPAEALAAVEAILAARPRESEARARRRLLLLQLGRFAEAWTGDVSVPAAVSPAQSGPAAWTGEAFPGKTLFLSHSGNLEDGLQFVRYAPLARARGGKVLLYAPPQLRRLYAGLAGIALSDEQRAPEGTDLQAALPDLPRIFQTTLDDIPAEVPYLAPDRHLVRLWADRLAYFPRPRVGLCWRPGIVARGDSRSMPLPVLMEGFAGVDVSLISLQRDAARRQIAAVGHVFDPKADPDYGSTAYEDYADIAAVMANLDLVVSVDSSAAHLAGAIGRPGILLLPFAADWRWLVERPTSPWYPTLALIRQEQPGDWHGAAEKLGDALRAVLQNKS